MFNNFFWYGASATSGITISVSPDLAFRIKLEANQLSQDFLTRLIKSAPQALNAFSLFQIKSPADFNLATRLIRLYSISLDANSKFSSPVNRDLGTTIKFFIGEENDFSAYTKVSKVVLPDQKFDFFPFSYIDNPFSSPVYKPRELPQWLRLYRDNESLLGRTFTGWTKGTVLETRKFIDKQFSRMTDISQPRNLYKVLLNRHSYPTDDSISQVEITYQNLLFGGSERSIPQASSIEECLHSKTKWGIWYYVSNEGALYVNNIALMSGFVSSGYGWVDLSSWFAQHPPDAESSLFIKSDDQGWEAPYNSDLYQHPFVYFPYESNFTVYYSDSTLTSQLSGLVVYLDGISYDLQKINFPNGIDYWAYLYDLRRKDEELNSSLQERAFLSSILSLDNHHFLSLGAQFGQVQTLLWFSSGAITFPSSSYQVFVLDLPARSSFREALVPVSGAVVLTSIPSTGSPLCIDQYGKQLRLNIDYKRIDTIQDGQVVSVKIELAAPYAKLPVNASYQVEHYNLNYNSEGLITGITPTSQCPLGWNVVLYLEDIISENIPKQRLNKVKWDQPLVPNSGLGTFD